jgi:hypothetical protein
MKSFIELGGRLGACLLALALLGPIGCNGGGGEGEGGEGEGEEGPTMSPGDACLDCHTAGSEAGAFTAAGTVFTDSAGTTGAQGATITITDANANELQLTANSVGNFYTSEALAFPIHISITNGTDTVAMASDPTDGNCGTCHGSAPIHIP